MPHQDDYAPSAPPGFMIRRLQQVSVALFHGTLENVDLTPVQHTILQAIRATPDLDQNRVAGVTFLDASTTSNVLKRLEARGLITREVAAQDRRARVLRLTEAGADLLDRVRPDIMASQRHLLSPLSSEERQAFLMALEKVLAFHEGRDDPDSVPRPFNREQASLTLRPQE